MLFRYVSTIRGAAFTRTTAPAARRGRSGPHESRFTTVGNSCSSNSRLPGGQQIIGEFRPLAAAPGYRKSNSSLPSAGAPGLKSVRECVDKPDYDKSRYNVYPIGNLGTRYRCFPAKPFHGIPPRETASLGLPRFQHPNDITDFPT